MSAARFDARDLLVGQQLQDEAGPDPSASSSEKLDPFLVDLIQDHDAICEARMVLKASGAEDLLTLESGNLQDPSRSAAPLENVFASPSAEQALEQLYRTMSEYLSLIRKYENSFSDDPHFLEVSQMLALLSRNQFWAVALTEQGHFDMYLRALRDAPNDSDEWVDLAIRIVANCCTRSHRTKIRASSDGPIHILVGRLARKETAAMTAKAMYAISSGVERNFEALEKSSHSTSRLLDGIAYDYYDEDDVDVVIDLLAELTPFTDELALHAGNMTTLIEAPLRFGLNDESLAIIGNLFIHCLPEDVKSTANLAAYLRIFLRFFAATYPKAQYEALINVAREISCSEGSLSVDLNPRQDRCRTDLISKCGPWAKSLEDVRVVEVEIALLVRWLTISIPQIQILGCFFLGNVVYHHPEHAESLVRTFDLAKALKLCIKHGKDYGVLTSAFDLLQNTATSSLRKEFGAVALLESLACHWQPLGYFSENALLFLDVETPGTAKAPDDSLLLKILDVYAYADDATVRAEIGKVIAEVWRTLEASTESRADNDTKNIAPLLPQPSSSTSFAPTDHIGENIQSRPRIASEVTIASQADGKMVQSVQSGQSEITDAANTRRRPHKERLDEVFFGAGTARAMEPILGLVKSENETLISQGLFTFSLMAQRSKGAKTVYECCIENESNIQILQSILSAAETHPALRSNAQYLVATLRRHFVNGTEPSQKLEQLIR